MNGLINLWAVKDIQHGCGTIQAGREFRATEANAEKLLSSGQAVRYEDRQVWDGLSWPNSHIVCIASGPSLTPEDCEVVRKWREASTRDDRFVFVVNTTYKAAPWADVLYASDEGWWANHNIRVSHEFKGRRFTCASVGDVFPSHIKKYDLQYVMLERGSGLHRRVGYVNGASNSGYQAVGLAYQAGATKITMLGYDMIADGVKEHWHPEHEWRATYDRPYRTWQGAYPKLYEDLLRVGVTVVNASRRTALKIPRVPLEQALND